MIRSKAEVLAYVEGQRSATIALRETLREVPDDIISKNFVLHLLNEVDEVSDELEIRANNWTTA